MIHTHTYSLETCYCIHVYSVFNAPVYVLCLLIAVLCKYYIINIILHIFLPSLCNVSHNYVGLCTQFWVAPLIIIMTNIIDIDCELATELHAVCQIAY